MSVGSDHLTAQEKLELAQGILEYGPALDHLDECDDCAAEVERMSVAEERRICAKASNAAPDWLRDAALKSLREFEPGGREATDSEPPISGRWTIRPNPKDRAPSRYVGPGVVAVVGVAALAAAVAVYLKATSERGPVATAKGGGVSAELFCAEPGAPLAPLGATDSTCALDAKLVVRAEPAQDNRLPFLTVILCNGDRCESVSRSRFTGSDDFRAAVPLTGRAERVDVILVWSDRELSDDLVADSAKSRREEAGVPVLVLPSTSWAQVGFALRTLDGPKPR